MVDWKNIKKATDEESDEYGRIREAVSPYRFRMDEPMTEREAEQIARMYYLDKMGLRSADGADGLYDSRFNFGLEDGNLTFNGKRLKRYDVSKDSEDMYGPWYSFRQYADNTPVNSSDTDGQRWFGSDGRVIYDTTKDKPVLPEFIGNEQTDYSRRHNALFASADWGNLEDLSSRIDEERRMMEDAYERGEGPRPDRYFRERREMELLDPNGYIRRWGLVPGSGYFNLPNMLWEVRAHNANMRWLYDNDPAEYERISEAYGMDPLTGEPVETARRFREKAEKRRLDKINARWGDAQVRLTPRQFAYWDAKRRYNENAGNDLYWGNMMKAREGLTPADLGQVKRYNFQQRLGQQRINGKPLTSVQMMDAQRQEDRRRQNLSRDMYQGDVKGMKQRGLAGVQPIPTPTWNY